MRRLRSLVIALAALAISAGVALAGHALPSQASRGLDAAAQAGTNDASVTVDPSSPDEDAAEEQAESAGTDESTEPEETAPETTAPETTSETGTHGALVSEAASGETPDGWANHGAYVSAVARGLAQPGDPAPEGSGGRIRNGSTDPAPADATTQTTKSKGLAKGHGKQH